MPINLSKGQKVDLTKGNPGLKSIMVGLGWDVKSGTSDRMCQTYGRQFDRFRRRR